MKRTVPENRMETCLTSETFEPFKGFARLVENARIRVDNVNNREVIVCTMVVNIN